MKWGTLTILLALSCASLAGDGSSGQPNFDCIQRIYQVELERRVGDNPNPGRQDRMSSYNFAISACRKGLRVPCFEKAFKFYLEYYPKKSLYYNNLNRAIRMCRDRIRADCHEITYGVLKNYQPKLNAWESAANACNKNTRTPCMAYAFSVEQTYRENDLAALNGAMQICRTGLSGQCLREMHEEFLPNQLPWIRDRWGTAVNACRTRD